MSRMIDRLRRRLETATPHQDRYTIRKILCDSAIVSFAIDNVAEYFFRNIIVGDFKELQQQWKLKDFPILLPPFEVCFFEFAAPSHIRNMVEERESFAWKRFALREYTPSHGGALTYVIPIEKIHNELPQLLVSIPSATKWGLLLLTFSIVENRAVGPLCKWLFFLDSEGHHVPITTKGDDWVPVEINALGKSLTLGTQEATLVSLNGIFSIAYPIFLAISLLHCKNIQKVDHTPNKKASAEQRRLSGYPLVTYYTLNIDPMKKVLREEGQIESNGLKKALHICRGHFADYTEGKGLFGKYHGQFWVPQHVKGSASQGIVEKDYSIKAPTTLVS